MYYVYVLRSENGEHYIGFTSNVERRLAEHNEGQNRSTSGRFGMSFILKPINRNKQHVTASVSSKRTDVPGTH